MRYLTRLVAALAIVAWGVSQAAAAELTVGPGKNFNFKFAAVEEAVKAAGDGDVILVWPREGNRPYEQVAVWAKKRITLRAVPGADGARVKLSGEGHDYVNPRAIVQFDPGADGSVVEGFEIFAARDTAGSASGVRINQANNVTIRNCEVHHCVNGIFSNGKGRADSAANQRIENCTVHDNGAEYGRGSHNCYLGGAGVTIIGCNMYAPTTGQSLKSRCHQTVVAYSYIHDSLNREFDLVDGHGDTDIPDSHAFLIGNLIVKAPKCDNPAVIHFGQDGGFDRDGTLFMMHNTLVTSHRDPIIELSAPSSKVRLANNIFWSGGSKLDRQELILARKGAKAENLTGTHNWIGAVWADKFAGTGMSAKDNFVAAAGVAPPFVNPAKGDFHLSRRDPAITDAGLAWKDLSVPAIAGLGQSGAGAGGKKFAVPSQFKAPLGIEPRPDDGRPDLGAFEFAPVATTRPEKGSGGRE